MNPYRLMASAAVVVLLASCGHETATTTPPTTTTVATTTTAATPTTATMPVETTLPGDLHPSWGVSWSAVWPPETATAAYRVQVMGGDWMELPARFEYGVEWRGGTWDRLVIGTVEPGHDGAALYFSRPEPWVLRLWGVEQTSADRDDTVLEYFENPQDLDFGLLPGDSPTVEGSMLVQHGFGTSDPIPAVYRMEWVGEEAVEVPAGTIEGAYHVRFGLGGDFYPLGPGGETEFFSDLWLHPEHLIVKWEPGPAGGPIELVTPWALPD